jgi:hypothetical protein
MRVVVALALLFLLLFSLEGASVVFEGVVGSPQLRCTLDSKAFTFSLDQEGHTSFAVRNLPLGGGFSLSRSQGTLGYHLRSLQTVIVNRLSITHGKKELLLFAGQNATAGAIFSAGSFTVGLTQMGRPATPKLFHRWQDERSGLLYGGRWRLQKGVFKVDLEIAGSEARPLRLIEEISYHGGPLVVSRQIGPLSGQRSQKISLTLASKAIEARTLLGVELGPEALYSGLYQTMKRTQESTVSIQGSSWKVTLGQRVLIALDKTGNVRQSRHLEATLKVGAFSFFVAWDDGRVRSRLEGSAGRLIGKEGGFSASFGFDKDGWHFDLVFTELATVSVRWSYCLTIDRGSESPRLS